MGVGGGPISLVEGCWDTYASVLVRFLRSEGVGYYDREVISTAEDHAINMGVDGESSIPLTVARLRCTIACGTKPSFQLGCGQRLIVRYLSSTRCLRCQGSSRLWEKGALASLAVVLAQRSATEAMRVLPEIRGYGSALIFSHSGVTQPRSSHPHVRVHILGHQSLFICPILRLEKERGKWAIHGQQRSCLHVHETHPSGFDRS